MSLQIRRGTNAERLTITPLTGELVYTTDTQLVYVGDGTTVGGILVGTGSGGNGVPGGANTQLQFNANGAFGGISTVTWDGSNLSLGTVANVKIAGGSNAQVLSTDGTGNLSWATPSGGTVPIANNTTPGIMALGNGFVLNASNQVSTSRLYNTNLTQPTQHYSLEVDTNGVVVLPDQSIINGSTLRAVAGSYAGLTTNDGENSWMWVDASGAYIATQYNQAGNSNQWTFDNTGNLTLPGNTFAVNYANGTQVPLGGSYGNANVVALLEGGIAGNIVPSGNSVYSLGNATNQWKDLFVSNATIYMNGVALTANATTLFYANTALVSANGSANITTTGDITANVISANLVGNASTTLLGNGAGITNVNAVQVVNGSSNVAIPTTNGNVVVTSAGTQTWTFDTTGNFRGTGNVVAGNLISNAVVGNSVSIVALDANGIVALIPGGPNGYVSVANTVISNVATPLTPQDAATKAYVDERSAGLVVHPAVALATVAALPAYTFTPGGTPGIGDTITANVNGALTIDGVLATATSRVLIKNETLTNAPYNGIYDVTDAGGSGAPFILTRASDFNTATNMLAAYTLVTGGLTLSSTGWVLSTPAPIVVDTTPLLFTQFSSTTAYTGANGISVTGTVISALLNSTTLSLDLGGNIQVANSAAFVTPNIGNATGSNLTLSGTANTFGLIVGDDGIYTDTDQNLFVSTGANASIIMAAGNGTFPGDIYLDGGVNPANTLVGGGIYIGSGNQSKLVTIGHDLSNPLYGITTTTIAGNLVLPTVANVKLPGGSNAQVLSTDGTGNLSWVAQTANETVLAGEFHVSPSGNDTTGDGTQNHPYQTIDYAITQSTGSNAKIILHVGTYAPNVTLTGSNISLVAAQTDTSSLVSLGNVLINDPATNVRLQGLSIANLLIDTSGTVYGDQVEVLDHMDKTGTGFSRFTNCDFETTADVTMSGSSNATIAFTEIIDTPTNNLVVQANAKVLLRDAPFAYDSLVDGGTLIIFNSSIAPYAGNAALSSTSNGGYINFSQCSAFYANGALAPITIDPSTTLAYKNSSFDYANSTLGTPANLHAEFQFINTYDVDAIDVNAGNVNANTAVNIVDTTLTSGNITTTALTQTAVFTGSANTSYEVTLQGVQGANIILTKVLATYAGDYVVYGNAVTGTEPGSVQVTSAANTVTVLVTPSSVSSTKWTYFATGI